MDFKTFKKAAILLPKDVSVMMRGRHGIGKCLNGNTKLICPHSGQEISLKDCVNDKKDIYNIDYITGRVFSTTPLDWIYSGKKQCLNIKTKSGNIISATKNHRFYTVDGWKKLSELTEGDYVASISFLPEPKNKIEPPDYEVFVLSGLLAEGGYSDAAIRFTNHDNEIVSIMKNCVGKYNCVLNEYSKGQFSIIKSDNKNSQIKNYVREQILDKYECGKLLSKEKKIPNKVFSYSNEKLAKFIGYFWSCDGTILPKTNNIEIALASKELVYQLKILLLRFGIISTVRHRKVKYEKNGKKFDAWSLRVVTSSFENFKNNIPLYGPKKEKIKQILNGINPNYDTIPLTYDFRKKIIKTIRNNPQIKITHFGKKIGWKTKFHSHYLIKTKTISKRVFSAFCEHYNIEEWKHYNSIFWDKISKIEKGKIEDVYDLTVDKTHNFIASSFVVHNSQVSYQMAEQFGLPMLERRLAQLNEGDLIGLPELDGKRTRFLPPDWFYDAMNEPRLIFLDEFDRSQDEVQNAAFELVLDRTIQGNKIHPDCRIYAAINGGKHGGNYNVSTIDPALNDRFWIADIEPTIDEWLDWGRESKKIIPEILDFITANSSYLEERGEIKDPNRISPSRRTWERLSNTLKDNPFLLDELSKNKGLFLAVCSGFVGLSTSSFFKDFLSDRSKHITAEDILNNLSKHEKVIKKAKLEHLNSIIDKIQDNCMDQNEKVWSDSQAKNLYKFFLMLPAEQRMSLWYKISKSGTKIDNAKIFGSYISDIMLEMSEG